MQSWSLQRLWSGRAQAKAWKHTCPAACASFSACFTAHKVALASPPDALALRLCWLRFDRFPMTYFQEGESANFGITSPLPALRVKRGGSASACVSAEGTTASQLVLAHRKPSFQDAVFGHFLSSSTRGVRASSQTGRAGVVGRERRAARETARRSGRTGAGTRVLCLGFQKGPSELAIFLFSVFVLIPFLGFLQYYTIIVFAKE